MTELRKILGRTYKNFKKFWRSGHWIDCCGSGVLWVNVGSATWSAYVGGWARVRVMWLSCRVVRTWSCVITKVSARLTTRRCRAVSTALSCYTHSALHYTPLPPPPRQHTDTAAAGSVTTTDTTITATTVNLSVSQSSCRENAYTVL